MGLDNDEWTVALIVEPIYLIGTTTQALPNDVIDLGSAPIYAGKDFSIGASIPSNLLELLNPPNYLGGEAHNWLELVIVPLDRLCGNMTSMGP